MKATSNESGYALMFACKPSTLGWHFHGEQVSGCSLDSFRMSRWKFHEADQHEGFVWGPGASTQPGPL